MTVIRAGVDAYTVVVTVDTEPEFIADLERHARLGLEVFKDIDGFISGALHKSHDGTRLIQYLQWESESAHLACMTDKRWDELESTRRFMELVHSGRATMVVKSFAVLATADASDG